MVAAHLLKAKFEDSAYGCKLYCCWCAQDLTHANEFWEAMGFSALAFRTGSTKTKFVDRDGNKKTGGRIHIFWQKRIRIGDHVTPWWYPSETTGGALGANRIALPIPPGTHWSDAKPVVLPPELLMLPEAEGGGEEAHAEAQRRKGGKKKQAQAEKGSEELGNAGEKSGGSGGGLGGFAVGFGPSPALLAAQAEAKEAEIKAKKARLKAKRLAERARQKTNDPALCAFSRELRDRWQECVEQQPGLIEGAANARYEVGRLIEGMKSAEQPTIVLEVVSQVIPQSKRIEAA